VTDATTRGASPPRLDARLPSEADVRVTGSVSDLVVVCVDGGSAEALDGTWNASLAWLVERLAPTFPGMGFIEVRYRIKSWNRLEMCIEDARAAIAFALESGAERCLLVGFSMGGAVAISVAGHDAVSTVVGLAPWIPDQLDLEPLRGRRLVVVHGALDRPLPRVPGVSPAASRRGFDRAVAHGAVGTYTLIPGALHAIALSGPRGRPIALPRAGRWLELVAAEVERFEEGSDKGPARAV